MDKQQVQRAQEIIRNTFENSFDKERFTTFIRDFLNSIDESKAFHARSYVKEMYSDVIKTYERIGTYNSPDGKKIDIIITYLQKGQSLDRARVTQRNFAGRYLSDRGNKNAGLFAFVSPEESDWRFSLVTIDYEIEQTKSGKWKGEEIFSQAKRWSFLVGANEKSHTAQSRLVDILADDEQAPTLEEIKNAFDIETVTKEFFLKYRELFLRTKEELDRVIEKDPKVKADFEAKGVDAVNFAKKLLGQIVFLYFLQKKGWFGVPRGKDWGEGNKQFLRYLFERAQKDNKNYFNKFLEPLFYEALRLERPKDYYDQFECRIPFLNGGLFDPIGGYDWVKTVINIPDTLFSNKSKNKEGDGILDIFDLYNFTVKEDEPLEKEVAIDPELLGKAYEKFNAIRPDNYEEYKKALESGKKGEESKFNKQFGVYYTPREIVHYMCQQSLINYLYNELNKGLISYEKLGDPQLHMFGNEAKSGQLDLMIEHKSTPSISKEDIEILIHIGEHVSENEARVLRKGKETETYYYQLPESIRNNAKLIDDKLANITVCDPAVGSGAFPVGMMSEIVRSRNVLSTFVQDSSRSPYEFKRRCIEHSLYGVDIDPGAVEIAKLRLWLSLVVDEEDIKNIKPLPNLDYKVICGNSLLGVEHTLENWKEFAELEKLKLLHFPETNPTKKQEYKKKIDELINQITSGHKEFDFEVYFSEVFHEKGGFDVVIANPPYGHTISENKEYFTKHYISTEGKHEIFKYFIEKGLSLLSKNGMLTYITSDTWTSLGYFKKLRKLIYTEYCIKAISKSLYNVFETATVDTNIYFIEKSKPSSKYFLIDGDLKSKEERSFEMNDEFVFNLKDENIIVKKIGSSNAILDEFCEIWQGLIAYGTKDQPREFTSDRKETKFHRKLLYGGDISKYNIVWSGEYLKYGDWLHRPRPSYIYDNEKILVQRIRNPQLKNRLVCAIDSSGFINGTGSSNIFLKNKITNPSLKYLLALMNSKLINYWFSYYFIDVNIKPEQLRKIPIKTTASEKQFISIVDKILEAKEENPKADTSKLEREIDQMVYKLYNLTPEEIAIVEGSGK